jgi:hypothetical protein
VIDLDLTSGKGVIIAVGVVAALLAAWLASTLIAIVILVVAIAVVAYLLWAIGVRINRRITGRSGGS